MIDYNNFNEVRDHLNFKLVNLENNIYKLTSNEIPHAVLANYDLAYYICITQDIESGVMNTLVSHDLLRSWCKSYNDVYEIALKNFRKQETEVINMLSMNILTNKKKLNGAIRIFDRYTLRKVTDHDFVYLLPSSIHEWIIQPVIDKEMDDDIHNLLKTANKSLLEPKDILSNKLYLYNKGQDKFYQYQYEEKSWLGVGFPDFSKVIL